MPGRASDSRLGTLAGIVFAAIAVFGHVVLGWRFGGSSEPVAVAIAALAILVTVGLRVTDA